MRNHRRSLSDHLALALAALVAATACKSIDRVIGATGKAPRSTPSSAGVASRPRSIADPSKERMEARHDERRRTVSKVIAIEAAPGVARVGPRKPDWCDAIPEATRANAYADNATRSMQEIADGRGYWGQTQGVLLYLCASPDDAKVQEQAGHLVQLWVNETRVAPEQLTPFFRAFATGEAYEDAVGEACRAVPHASGEASPREKIVQAVARATLGCGNRGLPYWLSPQQMQSAGFGWEVDLGAVPVSELVRSYLVLSCLVDRDGPPETDDLVAYAVCGPDARALDTAALEKDIASYPELAKSFARQQHGRARRLAARFEEAARAKAAADAAWKSILFDAPTKAWKEWQELYAAHRQVIDAARAYEVVFHGQSRAAARGCWGDAWNRFSAHVAGRRPRTILESKRAMTEGAGAILLEHAIACGRADGHETLVHPARVLLSSARPVRGPRYAAYQAALDALNEVKKDRPKLDIDPRSLGSLFLDRSPHATAAGQRDTVDLSGSDPGGVVKSVAPIAGGVQVEFKTERWQEEKQECHDTSKIYAIEPGGRVIYHRACKSLGMEWVENTHHPIKIPAALAAGIRPGAFVRSSVADPAADYTKTASLATPVEVWDSKEKTTLRAYLGVPLGDAKR
jgi:hypothetical protein